MRKSKPMSLGDCLNIDSSAEERNDLRVRQEFRLIMFRTTMLEKD